MKFGQQLLESMPPDWRFYFVDYQGLKQFIKMNTQVKGPWNNNHETQFIAMLEDEVKKVRLHSCAFYSRMGLREWRVRYYSSQGPKLLIHIRLGLRPRPHCTEGSEGHGCSPARAHVT